MILNYDKSGDQCKITPSSSQKITGVKQPRAGLLLEWVTCENVRQHIGLSDPEYSGCLTEGLQRLGMVTTPC